MSEIYNQAIAKIDEELKNFKGGRKEEVVKSSLAETLKKFCEQSNDFAAAVLKSEKALSDCCKTILSQTGNSISDFEVYKRAAEFYFPGAIVKFEMKIVLNGQAELEKEAESGTEKNKVISIFDLM